MILDWGWYVLLLLLAALGVSVWILRKQSRTFRSLVDRRLASMESLGFAALGERTLSMDEGYVDLLLEPLAPDRHDAGAAGPGSDPMWGNDLVRRLSRSPGRVFVVLGGPGSGKTTLMRYAASALNRRVSLPLGLPGTRYPVLLYLRDHTARIVEGDGPDITAVVAGSPRANALPTSWLTRWLQRGRCVVLLDGIDEVGGLEERARAMAWVRRQIDTYPRNTWVITSRPYGYRADALAEATVLGIQELGQGQIRRFLLQWCRAMEVRPFGFDARRRGPRPDDPRGHGPRLAEGSARDLLDRVSRSPSVAELAANPLLLTMIAAMYPYRGSLPGTAADFYRETTQLLLYRRQLAKGIDGPDDLSPSQKSRVVRALAFGMMEAGRRSASVRLAERSIGPLLDRLRWPSSTARFLDSLRESGMLVVSGEEDFAFVSHGLQEYLAAEHVLAHGSARTLIPHLDDPSWRETIVFWASETDAAPIVEACLDAATPWALDLARACESVSREIAPELRAALARQERRDGAHPAPGALAVYAEEHWAGAAHEVMRRAALEGRRIGPDDLSALPRLRRPGTGGRPAGERAAALLSRAVLNAELGRAREAAQYRFQGLVALAAAMRHESREASRDLSLAALRCLPGPDRTTAAVGAAVLGYLGADPGQPVEEAVARAVAELYESAGRSACDALVPLLAEDKEAARLVLGALAADDRLTSRASEHLGARGDGAPDWTPAVDAWRRERRRLAYCLGTLLKLGLSEESLVEAEAQIAACRRSAPAAMELGAVADALAELRVCAGAWRFDEKDGALRAAGRIAGAVRAAIRGAPTELAVELVEPVARRIEELVADARHQLAVDRPPRPRLGPAVPRARLRDGTVTVALKVSNADGSAPVESAWLAVTSVPPGRAPGPGRVDLPSAVRGGGSRTVLVRVERGDGPTDAEGEEAEQDVELEVALHHRTRTGTGDAVVVQRLTVPVDREFRPIEPNPFAQGALGRPVAEPGMFKGRDELVDGLRAGLRAASSPGAGIAIFGQKRTGKSSISLHLRQRLSERDGLPVVDAGSLGQLTPQRTEGTEGRLLGALLWRILDGANRGTTGGGPPLLPPGFDRWKLITSPDPVHDCSKLFIDYRAAHPDRPPWVVFIDEFQYMDQWIGAGLVPPSFMQAFKAIIEKQLFHLVLVGQNHLESLIAADPNAFGVFGKVRVSHLDDEGARSLIQDPVRLGAAAGETSRYEGAAVAEIIRLTGKNPFYIQLFCFHLVRYLNDERAALVTEADVAEVAEHLLSEMKAADFDNLESPEPAGSGLIATDVRAVLAAVARASSDGPATLADIERCYPGELPRALLTALVEREIVRYGSGGHRIVVGLYEAWLRRYYGAPEGTA
ncbi:NACHT domain-containing protein [Streptomyces sp. NPDC059070]|uniref:NACHT domain-containing protein n=1 Tax=Streptomyces sp. NPDC059070 TaxID=3346713 RepID=UPI0036CF3CE6